MVIVSSPIIHCTVLNLMHLDELVLVLSSHLLTHILNFSLISMRNHNGG